MSLSSFFADSAGELEDRKEEKLDFLTFSVCVLISAHFSFIFWREEASLWKLMKDEDSNSGVGKWKDLDRDEELVQSVDPYNGLVRNQIEKDLPFLARTCLHRNVYLISFKQVTYWGARAFDNNLMYVSLLHIILIWTVKVTWFSRRTSSWTRKQSRYLTTFLFAQTLTNNGNAYSIKKAML